MISHSANDHAVQMCCMNVLVVRLWYNFDKFKSVFELLRNANLAQNTFKLNICGIYTSIWIGSAISAHVFSTTKYWKATDKSLILCCCVFNRLMTFKYFWFLFLFRFHFFAVQCWLWSNRMVFWSTYAYDYDASTLFTLYMTLIIMSM